MTTNTTTRYTVNVTHGDGSETIHSTFWTVAEAVAYRQAFIPADRSARIVRHTGDRIGFDTGRTVCDCGRSLEAHYLTVLNRAGRAFTVWTRRMLNAAAFVAGCGNGRRSAAFTLAEVHELLAGLLVLPDAEAADADATYDEIAADYFARRELATV